MNQGILIELNKIRSIFNCLGIHIVETDISPENSIFYSVNIEFGNKELYNIGLNCNGNGTTYIYALLSAYGELIERIQNDAFFSGSQILEQNQNLTNKSDSLFTNKLNKLGTYQPLKINKKFINIEELGKEGKEVLYFIFGLKTSVELKSLFENKFGSTKVDTQEFIKISGEGKVLLPFGIMQNFSSVNGMCSGITKEEALIRGICEIIEKHHIWRIYSKKEELSIISRESFKNLKIFDKIKKIEERNFSVRLFDCSFESKLPVVGILVVNKRSNKHAFAVSSHPHYEKAITRALVKIFKIDTEDKFNSWIEGETNTKKEYHKSITTGSGKWPTYLLNINSYKTLSDSNFISSTNSKDQLSHLYNRLLPEYEIYVRNNTFLEVEAYYVYIPKMSEIVFRMDLNDYWLTQNMLNEASGIFSTGFNNLKFDTNFLSNTLYSDDFRIAYLYQKRHPFLEMDEMFVKALICIMLKKYKEAELFLKRHMSQSAELVGFKDLSKPKVLLDFIYYINRGKSIDNTSLILQKYYNTKDVVIVSNILNEKEKIENIINIPSCYNCSNCPVENDCYLFKVMDIYLKINKIKNSELLN